MTVSRVRRTAPRKIAASPAIASIPSTVAKVAPAVSRIAAAMPAVKAVAKAAGRGTLAGMAVNTVLSAGVGAYRDGVRGAGRGLVEGLTFGLGTLHYDRKFGRKHIPYQLDGYPDEGGLQRGLTDRNIARTTRSVGVAYGANLLKVHPLMRAGAVGYAVLDAALDAATVGAAIEAVKDSKRSGQPLPVTQGGIVHSIVRKAKAAPSGKPRGFANPEIRKAAQAAKNAKAPARSSRPARGAHKSTRKGKRR